MARGDGDVHNGGVSNEEHDYDGDNDDSDDDDNNNDGQDSNNGMRNVYTRGTQRP